MTREEIIRNLKYTMKKHKNDRVDTFGTNISLMCKDILDYLEKEPCGKDINVRATDAISRQAVKELFQEACEMKMYDFLGIDDIPSVIPQPKTGHWIDIMVGDMPAQACDQCNTFYPLAYTGGGHKYCPNCGSKMEV